VEGEEGRFVRAIYKGNKAGDPNKVECREITGALSYHISHAAVRLLQTIVYYPAINLRTDQQRIKLTYEQHSIYYQQLTFIYWIHVYH
jgi:hypothetical protein